MAFIDIEQEATTELKSTDTVSTKIDGYQQSMVEINNQRNVEEATFMEKWSGFSDTWDTTYAGRAIDYMANDLPFLMDDVDVDWQRINDDKIINERLNNNGIQPKYSRQFADAKNEPHFNAILKRVIETQDAERNVGETLNSYGTGLTERAVSTFVTNLADIDAVTSGGLSVANKVASLRTLMLQNKTAMALGTSGIHATTSKIAYETDPNVTSAEAVFFGTVGALADIGQVKYYDHKWSLPKDDVVDGVANRRPYQTYKDALDEDLAAIRGMGADHVEYSQYVDGINAIERAGIITKEEASSLLHGLSNKSVMAKAKIRLKARMNPDGTVSVRGSVNKWTVAALVSMGFAVEAEGSDGVFITAFGLGAFALLGAAGFLAVRGAKNAGVALDVATAADMSKKFWSKVKEFKSAEDFRVSLFESTQPIRNAFKTLPPDIKKAADDLLNKLLFDTSDGTVMTLERNRDRMFNSWDKRSLDIMSTNYRQWLRTNGLGTLFTSKDELGYYIGSRNQFEQAVFNHMEGVKVSDNANVIKAADDIAALKKRVDDELAEAVGIAADKIEVAIKEAKTTEDITKLSDDLDYINGILKSVEYNKLRTQNMHVIINAMSREGVELLAQKFADMSGLSLDDMTGLFAHIKAGKTFEESLEGLAKYISTKEGVPLKEITFNKAKFTPFEYQTITGESGSMTLNDLFEINPSMAMSTYAKDIAGHIAMLDAGLSERSVMEFLSDLKKTHGVDEVAVQDLVDAVNLVMGRPILDQSSTLSKFRRDASNYVMSLTMGLSVLSQAPEVVRMLFTSSGGELKQLSSQIRQIFKGYKHKGILSELLDDMGLAMDTKGLQFGAVDHIGDNNINVSTGRLSNAGNAFTKLGEMGRDASLYMMVQTSDFLTKLAMMRNLERLSEIVSGRSKLSADRMKIFGITEENSAMLKSKIGTLPKKLNLKDWSREDRLEFYKIMQNMTMKDVQSTTLGNAPAWQRNNEFGAAISLLTRFSTGAIANHGIYAAKGLRNGDALSVGRENVGMFVGGYLAAAMRDSLAGKEYDNDKYVLYGILGLGIVQPFEVVKSLADPSIFSKSADLADAVQTIITPQ